MVRFIADNYDSMCITGLNTDVCEKENPSKFCGSAMSFINYRDPLRSCDERRRSDAAKEFRTNCVIGE
jgi:hypothetical protein